jgi:trehalose/maltose hydrolase-like predicted phosphorylase
MVIQLNDPNGPPLIGNPLELEPAEVTAWRRAAESMYVPCDEQLGIVPRTTTSSNERPTIVDAQAF